MRWHDVRHELFVALTVFPHHDNSLADGGVAQQRSFDFTEFDSETTQFYLLVAAAKNSMVPSASQRTVSPVRYMRAPGVRLNGSRRNFSAVNSGWFR